MLAILAMEEWSRVRCCKNSTREEKSNSSIVDEVREADEGDEVGGGDEWPCRCRAFR